MSLVELEHESKDADMIISDSPISKDIESESPKLLNKSRWLLDFKSDVYSQTGEDGIIEKILDTISPTDKWCVEFGAWDGRFLSNTRNLIENKEYSAILIEGSREKFIELEKNYPNHKKVIAINRFIGFNEKDNLDQILRDTSIPIKFDFLSIDIDGNDYHVWKSISEYQPKVVGIEFNPTIPTEVSFVQPATQSLNQGCSLLALVELGKKKDYELVSVLRHNAFFVKSEYYPLFNIIDNRPEVLRVDRTYITYIFSGYDGQIFLRGDRTLPWHQVELKESKLQHLPKFFRKYPDNYSKLEKHLFLLFSNPLKFIKKLAHRIMIQLLSVVTRCCKR